MADSEFWRNLGEQFRALTEGGGDIAAIWETASATAGGPPSGRTWSLERGNRGRSLRFEALARRGGDAIERTNIDALYVWLEALKAENSNPCIETFGIISGSQDQPALYHTTGSVDNVIQASSDLCSLMESRALATEREARALEAQNNDPANWSQLRRDFEALRAMRALIESEPVEITEQFIRDSISRSTGVKPEDVSPQRIRFEVAGLLAVYPSIRVLPSRANSTNSPEVPEQEEAGCSRSKQVAAFISVCRKITGRRIYKRHIWLSVGHSKARQFEYWQACKTDKTTAADEQNFSRVLAMNPEDFVQMLIRKRILTLD